MKPHSTFRHPAASVLRSFVFACALYLGFFPSFFVLAAPKLRWKPREDTPFGPCVLDCKTNKDCKKGLTCTRAKGKKVKGCKGVAKPGRNYCTPAKNESTPKQQQKIPQGITHIGTSQAYVYGDEIYRAKIKVPAGTTTGDLLVLVLHRTDDYLPMGIGGGWTRACEYFKKKNSQDCSTYKDCDRCVQDPQGTKNVFCEKFKEGGQLGRKTAGQGRDLAQSIFYKAAGKAELSGPKTIKINLGIGPDSTNPGWMFLSTIRGADTEDPIRDWDGTGNDESVYSVFPSVYGKRGDLLLLSQGFDNGAPGVKEDSFLPPKGFQHYASMFDCDNLDTENHPYRLEVCQGDCDKDKECQGDLVCFERKGDRPVPGCYDDGVREKDYCWDPKGKSEKQKLKFLASDPPKCDESGYLFGKVLTKTGETGVSRTTGEGKIAYKSDSLVSVTIIPNGGSKDSKGRGASEWLGTDGKRCPRKKSKPKRRLLRAV